MIKLAFICAVRRVSISEFLEFTGNELISKCKRIAVKTSTLPKILTAILCFETDVSQLFTAHKIVSKADKNFDSSPPLQKNV